MAGQLNLSMLLRADASGFKSGVQLAKAETAALANAHRAAEAPVRALTSVLNAETASMTRAGVAARGLRGSFAQVGFQAQDLAIQLAAGVNPLQALAIQGGQLASVFGRSGIVIGTLLTVGGTLAAWLGITRERTEDLSDAQDLLSGRLGEGVKSADELRAAYDKLSTQAQTLERAIIGTGVAKANEQLAEARARVRELAAEIETELLRSEQNVAGSLPILAELLKVRQGATDAGAAIAEMVAGTEGLSPAVTPLARELVEQLKTIRDVTNEVERSEAELATMEGHATGAQIALLQDKATATREAAKATTEAEREEKRAADDAQRRRRQLAASFSETSSFLERQKVQAQEFQDALREADRQGMALANGLTGGLERAIFTTGTLTERISALGEELAQVLLRTFALEPLARALGTTFSGFLAPSAPSGPATGPGGLAVGGGVTSQIFHSGGVAGLGGATRIVEPAVFLGAPRLHSGGRIGRDEFPAILTRGETVLPAGVSAGGAQIVQIIDQRGASAPALEQRRERRAGGVEVTQIIIKEGERAIARGDWDRAMRARFGATRAPARR